MSRQGRASQRGSNKERILSKVTTGAARLDDILNGGFPEGRTTLISGGPGTGKTMRGLEFLSRSALAGHVGIRVSFEARAESIRMHRRPRAASLEAVACARQGGGRL